MTLRTHDVKFIVLVFFNLSCVLLCGWYGIQRVLKARETTSAAQLQARHDVSTSAVDIFGPLDDSTALHVALIYYCRSDSLSVISNVVISTVVAPVLPQVHRSKFQFNTGMELVSLRGFTSEALAEADSISAIEIIVNTTISMISAQPSLANNSFSDKLIFLCHETSLNYSHPKLKRESLFVF